MKLNESFSISMNRSASSPRPSPPFGMEERVAEGRERRRFEVLAFNARIKIRRNLTLNWSAGLQPALRASNAESRSHTGATGRAAGSWSPGAIREFRIHSGLN
jgi:hypothetical protein